MPGVQRPIGLQERARGDRAGVVLREQPPPHQRDHTSGDTSSGTREENQSYVYSLALGERRGFSSIPIASARVVLPSSGPFSNTSPRPSHSREA